MSVSPLNCLNITNLRLLAGDRWFARGQSYQQQGRVADLSADGSRLSANVTGTRTYRVLLSCRNSRIEFSCTCPVGEDREFCKHCVAVALSWIQSPGSVEPSQSGLKRNSELRSFLEAQDHSKLVEFILQEAERNRRLRDRLELETAREQPTGPNVSAFKKVITSATRTTGIDYYSMPRFARRLSEVIDSIKSLLDDGHAKAVVELTEYAFARLEKAIGEVDDSDGHFGDILPELNALHHSACVEAREDPLILARRLFEWELNSNWDFFLHAAANYSDVLGPEGLREYQRLAEVRWSQVPALGPGDADGERYRSRFRITSIMETLAIESGDLEALVSVKQRDLAHPYSFLQIADIYHQASRYDEALEWAEKGAYSFSRIDSRLSDFLAGEYHRRGRHADAMTLIWKQFVENPCLPTYEKLRANALKVKSPHDNMRLVKPGQVAVNTNRSSTAAVSARAKIAQHVTDKANTEWCYWREQALRKLRENLPGPQGSNRRPSLSSKNNLRSGEMIPISNLWERQTDRSLLVEVFLWEKEYEEAWQEATAGGCSQYLWLQLADVIAKKHPDRAFRVYQELIAPTIAPTNNQAYNEAIKLLKKMQKLASGLNREFEFGEYIADLRLKYKLKRNFIKLLDGMR